MKIKLTFAASAISISLIALAYFPPPGFGSDSFTSGIHWSIAQIKTMVLTGQIDPSFQKFFDRDPVRHPPAEKNIIVSPADGTIESIFTDQDGININISLSYFDVHVQRIPISGKVLSVQQEGSGYFTAKDPHYLNGVQTVTVLDTVIGKVTIKQLTSFFTKRIITYPKPGDTVTIGEKLGRILLGSTVIMYLPKNVNVAAKVGTQVYGAESIIARY